jgi:hypothetical protein
MNFRRSFTSSGNAPDFVDVYKVHLLVFLLMETRSFLRTVRQVEESPDAAKAVELFCCYLLPEASSE